MSFFELHFHGAAGFRTGDLSRQAYERMSLYLAEHNVDGFLAAFSAMPHELLLKSVSFAAAMCREPLSGAQLKGIYLEGPYLAVAGAMSQDQLARPSTSKLEEVIHAAEGRIKIMTVAPELPGILDAVRCAVDHNIVVAAGHTSCTAGELEKAVEAGVRHITHLGNNGEGDIICDRGQYRHDGPLLAMLNDERLTVEVICDGVHVPPELVNLFYRVVGKKRFAAVTDCCAAAGLAGQWLELANGAGEMDRFEVKNGALYTSDGGLTGSLISADKAAENLMNFANISWDDACIAADALPRRIAGYDQ